VLNYTLTQDYRPYHLRIYGLIKIRVKIVPVTNTLAYFAVVFMYKDIMFTKLTKKSVH
jgi:hypothetical protein